MKQQEDPYQQRQTRHTTHALVIRENPSVRTVFRLILQQEGHDHVTTMGIRGGAPAPVPQMRPDFILLDVNRTSGARGWTVLQQVHRSSPTKDRPLVLCAPTLALVPEQEYWLRRQGIALQVKPVGIEPVLQAVDRARACSERSEDHAIAWS